MSNKWYPPVGRMERLNRELLTLIDETVKRTVIDMLHREGITVEEKEIVRRNERLFKLTNIPGDTADHFISVRIWENY